MQYRQYESLIKGDDFLGSKERISIDEIAREISNETGHSLKDVKNIIKSTFDNIVFELSQGREVQVKGFGLFELKERAARTGRNIHTNEAVPIPSRIVPNFKPSEQLRNVVITEIKEI